MAKIIKYSISFIILSIIILLGILYYKLLTGIHLQNISLPYTNIKELYIKIDKKVIFRAKNIKINTPTSNEPTNYREISKKIRLAFSYLPYIEEISIKNLEVNNIKLKSILLKDNIFKLDEEYFKLNASIKINKNILINIHNIYIKPIKLQLNNIQNIISTDKNNLYITTHLNYKDSKITINTLINNNITYNGNITNITNKTFSFIKTIKYPISIKDVKFKGNTKQIKLFINTIKTKYNDININSSKTNMIYKFNNVAQGFIPYLHIKQKNLNISVYNIAFNFDKTLTLHIPKIDSYKNNIHAKLFNSIIKYNNNNIFVINKKSLIKFKKFNINIQNTQASFKNKHLKFKFNKIILTNKLVDSNLSNINGDYNITNNSLNLKINNSINRYKTLHNLKTNNINISYNKTATINIPLIKHKNIILFNNKLTYKNNKLLVSFFTKNLLNQEMINLLKTFDLQIPIYQKNGVNLIKGNLNINLNPFKLDTKLYIKVKKSKLIINKDTSLDIHQANLKLINDKIYLKNTNLDYNVSIINLNYLINTGLIDLNKSLISTNGKFKKLDIKNILKIKNYKEKLKIDLNKMIFDLPELNTIIKIKKHIFVTLNKLSTFQPYIKYLKQYNIKGKAFIDIDNGVKIKANITDTNQTIIFKDKHLLKKLTLSTFIKDKNITIKNKNKNINLNIVNDNNLSLKGVYANLDFNITSFVDNNKTDSNHTENKLNDTNKTNDSNKSININLQGYNTSILYKNYKLYSTKLDIKIKNKNTYITSLYKDRNITFIGKNDGFKLYGLNIKDKTFKDLTNTNILKKANLTFFALKQPHSPVIQGFVDINFGYITKLKALNNVIAFVNLIPSLITFQAVGFSDKGYKIKEGHIEYIYYNKILYLKKIHIKGINIIFDGNGYIDFNKHYMKINVKTILLVKLLKDIPIVNYILLGKNGGITLKLTVEGDISNPKVYKNTASNIIQAPIGIIKRAILTPFRPFMKDEK